MVLPEAPASVVPPRELPSLWVQVFHHILVAEPAQRSERGTLRGAHVGHADECRRIPDIGVARRDVEVSTNHMWSVGRTGVVEPGPQMLQPAQLDGVVGIIEGSTIGHVDARDANTTTGGVEDPAARLNLGVTESRFHALDAAAREDRDAVPLAVAVVRCLVAELGERCRIEGIVGHLRLLEQHHVDLGRFQPLEHPRHSGSKGVHVPGGDLHGARTGRVQPRAGRDRGRAR